MDELEGFIDVSSDKDKGVLKKIIKEGSGEIHPIKGAKVFVHYVGTFFSGEKKGDKFDSSRDRGEKFSFTLGEGQVIKAWDIGVATMKKGELCELICASSYAYGPEGNAGIPGNSTLKFEVELFEWTGKDISPQKDGSLTHLVLVEGVGWENPKDCSRVKISVALVTADGDKKEAEEKEFELGDGASASVSEGAEVALRRMKKGERALLHMEPNWWRGGDGSAATAGCGLELALIDFDKVKDSYSVDSVAEKLQLSTQFKDRATQKFQASRIEYARKLYEKAVSYLDLESDFSVDDERQQRAALLLSLRLNVALCSLRLGDAATALAESDKALELDEGSEKALYRRAAALEMRGDVEEASTAYKAVLAAHPANGSSRQKLAQCEALMRDRLRQEKELYRSMFASKPAAASSKDKPNGDEDKNDEVQASTAAS